MEGRFIFEMGCIDEPERKTLEKTLGLLQIKAIPLYRTHDDKYNAQVSGYLEECMEEEEGETDPHLLFHVEWVGGDEQKQDDYRITPLATSHIKGISKYFLGDSQDFVDIDKRSDSLLVSVGGDNLNFRYKPFSA